MLKKISASYTLVLVGLIVLLGSCKKEYENIQDTDDAKLQQFISANKLNVGPKDDSGFYYSITNAGTGDLYKTTDSVLYNISLKSLSSSNVYYSSPATANLGTYVGYTNSFTYPIVQVIGTSVTTNYGGLSIPAIRTVLQLLKPGGSARILLPSYLAFGRNGNTTLNVPSNELIDLTITTFPEKKQADLDDRLIRAFIAAKGITGAVKRASGTYYVITDPGSGSDVINDGTTINANYTGRLIDGTVFDGKSDGSFSSPLGSLVYAWREIVPLIQKGGKVRIIAPSAQAYGTTARPTTVAGGVSIPANSILDFDLQLIGVTN